MVQLSPLIFLTTYLSSSSHACISDFYISKQVFTTSNSQREFEWASTLMPHLSSQDASKFQTGKCAEQSKLQIDDFCWKLHHPSTWEHPMGHLDLHTLESHFTQKWASLSSPSTPINYDAFIDYNFAFWVPSLDEYIDLYSPSQLNVEHLLLKWKLPDSLGKKPEFDGKSQFYSVIVHSPESQVAYELISDRVSSSYFQGPWASKWMNSVMRASFGPKIKPWHQKMLKGKEIKMVPIRISRGTSNLKKTIDWYENLLESTIYHYEANGIDEMGGDDQFVAYAFLNAHVGDSLGIEIAFFERPRDYTYGDYSVSDLENDLNGVHQEIVTSPYCGFDRYFDNHYAYHTWFFRDGFLDDVLERVQARGDIYRLWRQPYEFASDDTKAIMDSVGATVVYLLYVIEPSGHSVQICGKVSKTDLFFEITPPKWDAQWCEVKCTLEGIPIENVHRRRHRERKSLEVVLDHGKKKKKSDEQVIMALQWYKVVAVAFFMMCLGIYAMRESVSDSKIVQRIVAKLKPISEDTPLLFS